MDGPRPARGIVRSAYGPWLLLALAVVALPASVPAAAAGHATRVSAVEARGGLLLAGFEVDPGDPGAGGGRSISPSPRRSCLVQAPTPRESLGVGVLALPPPALS